MIFMDIVWDFNADILSGGGGKAVCVRKKIRAVVERFAEENIENRFAGCGFSVCDSEVAAVSSVYASGVFY